MESDEKVIYLDDRGLDKLIDKLISDLEKHAEAEKFDVKVVKTRLKLFDVLYVHKDKRIGWELKFISTEDQEQSNKEGRSKDEVKRQIQTCDHPKFFWIIGNPNNMKYTDRKAMHTLKTEFNLIGVPSDTIILQYWAAFRIIRACQFYEDEKKIIFKSYCNPVIRDDSQLTKMMKQVHRIGDKTASSFGSEFNNFVHMFLTKEQKESLLAMLDVDELYTKLSNFARSAQGKKPQKSPLMVIKNFVNWFFGIDELPKDSPKDGVPVYPDDGESNATFAGDAPDGKESEMERVAREIAWAKGASDPFENRGKLDSLEEALIDDVRASRIKKNREEEEDSWGKTE